ncbi:putative dimethylaniline monooxygenase [Bisporella sp. PMI_857]|nr:putative dimethylaniline monooxygenase [Bisporella sp. PMI_857]
MGSSAPTIQEADVAIIGAGWYGLVAARTYLRLRPNVNILIIDTDSTVGGVWSEKRLYPNLVAQVNLGLFNYIDTPMPAEGVTNKRQVTGRMIHNYLQRYAEEHDLLRRIRFNTHVNKVERGPRGWRLHYKDSADILDTEKLMVATGVTSIPNMPEYMAKDVQVPVVHSRDLGESYNDLQQSKYQHVMVVGAAKSAYDAVYLLLTMGKKVTWVIRPEGGGPLAILPSELLGYFTSIGVASTRLMTGLSPSIFNTEGLVYSLFQANPIGRWLAGAFWDVVAYLSDLHAGYDKGGHVAGLRPEIDGKSIFWANSGLGVVTLPDFWSTIHKGDVTIIRDDLGTLNNDTMTFKSGKSVKSDFIVMCTGWGDHFAMFDNDHKTEIGLPVKAQNFDKYPADRDWKGIDREAEASVDRKLPFLAKGPVLANAHSQLLKSPPRNWRLYRRVVPLALAKKNDRSLAILGQIHTVQTPLVASVQTFWAILYLLGEQDLPHENIMVKEIAEWNAWTRKRYISQGRKFPYSLYDFLPYVETLCKDLGVNSRRKSNFISEYFSSYKPEDFNDIIDEYYAQKMIGPKGKGKATGSQYSRLLALILAGVGTLIALARWILSMM